MLVQALKKQLDAEMPLAKEADDTLVAKGLLSNPAEAAALFTASIDGYVDRIAREVDAPAYNTHRYTVSLYQRDDEVRSAMPSRTSVSRSSSASPWSRKPSRQGSTRTPWRLSWGCIPVLRSYTWVLRPRTSRGSINVPCITII